ncbi:MAG: YeeE/YedE family protein [Tistlia sp.]|uniref:YeeE/YedE family protein n=1 Tax=Tistlia sp. TaxID=3057121 RepID=UPI0034A48C5C
MSAPATGLLDYLPALLGGAMIGLSATLLLLLSGRIAGISGILAGVLRLPGGGGRAGRWLGNALFLLGLLLGPWLYRLAAGDWPTVRIEASAGLLVVAGLLVGFGTRLGSGCTSGHGVCGLARLSPRSLAAVGLFLGAAVATVFLQRLVGG